MKQGWEYKKLGEVCEVVSGSTPKTNVPEYWGEGHYWVTPAELNDNIVYIDKTERQITDEALTKTKLRLLPVGTVLLSSRAPIGKVAITKTEMYCNQGFKNCICSDSIYNKYLFYFLRLKKEYLNSLGRGATFKEISKSIVESITIPLPPKSTQLSIVSELDKINELIRLKKEQLKDYDNLAQSIFYEMFGDPVENDKGWEVKKLGEVCSVGTGSTPNRKNKEYYEHGIYPWVKSTEVCNLPIYSVEEFITEEALQNTNCGLYPKDSILMAMYGQGKTRGQVGLLKIEACTNQAVAAIVPSKKINSIFLYRHLMLMYEHIRDMARGGNQANLNLTIVRSIQILLPPLPLQHLFAQRIEQIERQKSAVQKSITDLETLLASRMQYWFE